MRFRKFMNGKGEVWIDLDAISVVQYRGKYRSTVLTNGWAQEIDATAEEVLALLQSEPQRPVPPPDTYEEGFADATQWRFNPGPITGGLEDRPMTADGADAPYYDLSSIKDAGSQGPIREVERPFTESEVESAQMAAVRLARLEELKRIQHVIDQAVGTYVLASAATEMIQKHIDWRCEAIHKKQV